MSGYSLKTRNFLSTWFNLGFFLLLISFIVFIEFFQNHHTQKSAMELLENTNKKDILYKAQNIVFENRLGIFKVTKKADSWMLEEPRVIPAKTETIQKIIDIISQISVKTIHQYEPINIQSFSLNNPIMKILIQGKDKKGLDLKIGLINPIDETSYITVNDTELIYQTNLLTGKLESLELADFIDSKIFTPSITEVENIKFFTGQNSQERNKFTFKNGSWDSLRYNVFSQEKLQNKIQEILDIRTHAIIDKSSEEVSNLLQNYLDNPRYRISIRTINNKTITYKVSYLTREIKELKIEKNQFFIMSASNRPYPYIIPKKFLDIFLINYNDIKR